MVGDFARINYFLVHGGGRVDIKHRLDVCCLRQRIIETAGIQAFKPDVVLYRVSADSNEELDGLTPDASGLRRSPNLDIIGTACVDV